MRPLIAPMVCLVALLVAACGAYFAPDRNIERRVERTEVIGTWRMTADSVTLLRRDGFKPTQEQSGTLTITLNEDGSLTHATARDQQEGGILYEAGSGTWELKHDARSSGQTAPNALRLVRRAAGSAGYRDGWGFDEVDGELRLFQYYGDPDLWEFLEYTKD